MAEWRWDLNSDMIEDSEWETGFETYDDAYEAMSNRLAELIDEIAEDHPDMSDEDIEDSFDWEVREE